jgi:hypothetical protein
MGAKALDRRSENSVYFSLQRSARSRWWMKMFWKPSSQETKLRFMGMTVIQNNSCCEARVPLQKKERKKQKCTWKENTVNHFVYYHDILHHKFLPVGQRVNWTYYLEVLMCLRDVVGRPPEMWLLHHDSAPAHTALSMQEFFIKRSIHVLPQPLYLPDLSLPDFLYSPK